MANGIIIVDKPADWTSQDVTAKLRGVFHERRIGHGGTLDPMATGVLPVFVGRATRGVSFFEAADKEYVAGIRLGVTTNTQDTTGDILTDIPVNIPRQQLQDVLGQFLGQIEQIPPMYSAIKIGGKKLCDLARKGQDVERKPRKITIFALELLEGSGRDYVLRVHCSKGTYIRTLCHDIGQALGCGACMSSLRRTRAGIYPITQAVTMQQILSYAESHDAQELLLPVDSMFSDHPSLTVTDAQAEKIRHGADVADRCFEPGTYRVYGRDGEFLALAEVCEGTLRTIKSFYEVKEL